MSQTFFYSPDEPDWDELKRGFDLIESGASKEAMETLKILAEKGSPAAPVYIGRMYEDGDGVRQDAGEAMAWYLKAAKYDFPTAHYFLGRLLENRGDYLEAIKWHEKASENNFIPSTFRLYRIYERGQGVERDLDAALAYLDRASAAGHIFAQRHKSMKMIKGCYGIVNILFGLIWFPVVIGRAVYIISVGGRPELIY